MCCFWWAAFIDSDIKRSRKSHFIEEKEKKNKRKEMSQFRHSVLLVLALVVIAQTHLLHGVHGSRPLPSPSPSPSLQHQGYWKAFEKLGVSCECCDGIYGICRSTWEGSCSNLQCLPWKLA